MKNIKRIFYVDISELTLEDAILCVEKWKTIFSTGKGGN
jgi:hypothetical protein